MHLITAVNLERDQVTLAIYSPCQVTSDEEDNH
jgi:hypothetical protein